MALFENRFLMELEENLDIGQTLSPDDSEGILGAFRGPMKFVSHYRCCYAIFQAISQMFSVLYAGRIDKVNRVFPRMVVSSVSEDGLILTLVSGAWCFYVWSVTYPWRQQAFHSFAQAKNRRIGEDWSRSPASPISWGNPCQGWWAVVGEFQWQWPPLELATETVWSRALWYVYFPRRE